MTKRSNMSGTAAHDGTERPEACSLPCVLLYELAFAEPGREKGVVGVADAQVRP